jgi:cytoskeletal protein CcmA (bactofilin family)
MKTAYEAPKMAKYLTKTAFTIGLLVVLLSVPAFGASVNKSVKVPAGTESGGATSVNGSVTVGADAVVTGDVKTVNGKVHVDAGASIEEASTVNGSVRIGKNVTSRSLGTVNGSIKVDESCTVDGEIEAVNGGISVASGTKIDRGVSNINGTIKLMGATVGGNVSTVSGDVHVLDGTVVQGHLIIEKPGGWGWGKDKRKPRVVIGPGSTIEGDIKLEREVELFISETASVGKVKGVMSMEDAVRFSGEKP